MSFRLDALTPPLLQDNGEKRLQVVLIKRKDTGEWAIPGGMVRHPLSLSLSLSLSLCPCPPLSPTLPPSLPLSLYPSPSLSLSAIPGGMVRPPTPYTLHLTTPCTLHPTPYTLHPTPHTLHPTPCTIHHTPHTTHPPGGMLSAPSAVESLWLRLQSRGHKSVTLSVATPLCPYGIAYRRAYGLSSRWTVPILQRKDTGEGEFPGGMVRLSLSLSLSLYVCVCV